MTIITCFDTRIPNPAARGFSVAGGKSADLERILGSQRERRRDGQERHPGRQHRPAVPNAETCKPDEHQCVAGTIMPSECR